jgi:hypothetical protein
MNCASWLSSTDAEAQGCSHRWRASYAHRDRGVCLASLPSVRRLHRSRYVALQEIRTTQLLFRLLNTAPPRPSNPTSRAYPATFSKHDGPRIRSIAAARSTPRRVLFRQHQSVHHHRSVFHDLPWRRFASRQTTNG